jgi:hypothetical protein
MGGKNYEPAYDIEMSIINRITTKTVNSGVVERPGKIYWQDIKDDKKNQFYSMRFDLSSSYPSLIISAKTTFINPNGKSPKTVIVSPLWVSKDDSTVMRPINIKGPINRGPNVAGFGVALSKKLMTDLGLIDGQVVYFTMEKEYNE